MRSELGTPGQSTFALGRSDANNSYTALYHDDRGVCRVFAMTFDGTRWTLTREDPDFHQRFIAEVGPERIAASDVGPVVRDEPWYRRTLAMKPAPPGPCLERSA